MFIRTARRGPEYISVIFEELSIEIPLESSRKFIKGISKNMPNKSWKGFPKESLDKFPAECNDWRNFWKKNNKDICKSIADESFKKKNNKRKTNG